MKVLFLRNLYNKNVQCVDERTSHNRLRIEIDVFIQIVKDKKSRGRKK